MDPHIETLLPKKLVGLHQTMSLAENKTAELWRSFMPLRSTIQNRLDSNLISMQVYTATYSFASFNPQAGFVKWAAVEVTHYHAIPDGMETFDLPGGLYAVFLHKGAASEGYKMFNYIFGTWVPQSVYKLDNRPHFEVLGSKYKNNDPTSEEEIWIPIKPKAE